jgi:hypothetical protein
MSLCNHIEYIQDGRMVYLGDFQGGYHPEISLAEEIIKVECEGHPLVKIW